MPIRQRAFCCAHCRRVRPQSEKASDGTLFVARQSVVRGQHANHLACCAKNSFVCSDTSMNCKKPQSPALPHGPGAFVLRSRVSSARAFSSIRARRAAGCYLSLTASGRGKVGLHGGLAMVGLQ